MSLANPNPAEVPVDVRFGGAAHASALIDQQRGPTCGFEAVENVIQLCAPGFTSSLSDRLETDAMARGWARAGHGGSSLAPTAYIGLLGLYGLVARWYALDVQAVLLPFLRQDHPLLLVVRPGVLDPATYGQVEPTALHAVVATNVVIDENGTLYGVVGMDSNVAGREVVWPLDRVVCAWVAVLGVHHRVWGPTAPFYLIDADGGIRAAVT